MAKDEGLSTCYKCRTVNPISIKIVNTVRCFKSSPPPFLSAGLLIDAGGPHGSVDESTKENNNVIIFRWHEYVGLLR